MPDADERMNVNRFLISPTSSIQDAMEQIDRNGLGIVLAVDADRKLLFTVTDGDVRRALLAHVDVSEPVSRLVEVAKPASFATPLTAAAGTPTDELLHLMVESTLRQIPLVDGGGRVVDVVVLDELAKDYELPIRAVVMAGGRGTRLHPLTEATPKPMLPVADRPILEHIVERLRDSGIRRVSFATHYRADQISNHFGTGEQFGVEIHYLEEEQPLGTAGALGLLAESDEPLLVVNGDILTRVDFRALLQFHREHEADMTVAVRAHELEIPFGVVETDGAFVSSIDEKPRMRQLVNAGIYLVQPSVVRLVTPGEPHDMVTLIERLLAAGRSVVAFPVREYWLDIGGVDAYERAQDEGG